MKLYKFVRKSRLFIFLYKVKFYIDVAIGQISWATGKLPEIMAFLYLSEKFGVEWSNWQIVFLTILMFAGFTIFGYFWKNGGFFDVEVYVNADKNPVQRELLKAARKINNEGRNYEEDTL